MSATPLILAPSPIKVTIDGVTIPADNWTSARGLMAQQVAVRRNNITFGITDRDGTSHGIYTIDKDGTIASTDLTTLPKDSVDLVLEEWAILNNNKKLISFKTLDKAFTHIQLVADTTKASIPITITGINPNKDIDRVFAAENINTGELQAITAEELERQMLEPHVSRVEEQETVAEEEPTVRPVLPELADETELPEVTTVSNETTEPEQAEEAVEEPAPEPEPEEESADEEAEVAPEPTEEADHTDSFFNTWEIEEAEPKEKKQLHFRKLIKPLSIAVATLALGATCVFGLTKFSADDNSAADNSNRTSISDTTSTIPNGYSNTALYSITIPDGAQTYATDAAISIINGQTVTLYNPENGQKIRDLKLDKAITSHGETTIGDENAIIFITDNKLTAYTPSMGADGKLITADLPDGSKYYASGSHLLVTNADDTKAWALTKDGLTEYKIPDTLTPLSMSKAGLISSSFNLPVETTAADGSTIQTVNLSAPQEGYKLVNMPVTTDKMVVSIWAETDAPADTDKALIVTNNLADGSVASTTTTNYQEAKDRTWVKGQGNKVASYGDLIYDATNGKLITQLPTGYSVTKIKGNLVIAQAATGEPRIFQSDTPGYISTSPVLLQTDKTVTVQQGNKIVTYPANLK